jgi:hypothetical protein
MLVVVILLAVGVVTLVPAAAAAAVALIALRSVVEGLWPVQGSDLRLSRPSHRC